MSGKRAKFQRHLKKAKKLCNENYLKDIKYHAVSESSDICYIKANCKPSMKNTVQVGNAGQLSISSVYTLNVRLTKLTGHIISAYCNCKAGEAGLCAHVGCLLFSIVRMKNACTSQGCTWDRPRAVQRRPSPKRVHEVRFHSATTNRPYPDTFQASACKDPKNVFR